MADAALQGGCRYCGEVIDPNMQAHAITSEVAAEHRVSVDDLCGPGRQAYLVAARNCAIRRIRAETNLYLKEIGALFGGRDHSTIIHALNGNGARAAVPSRQAQA